MKIINKINGASLYDFLKKESDRPYKKIATMAAISGLANALVLGIINAASELARNENASSQLLLMFIIALTLFIVSEYYILKFGSEIMEEIIDKIRVRLTNKVRNADLLSLEKIGTTEIYNRLTHETSTISQSAGLIVATMQSIVMLTFVVLYIAYLSVTAFFLIVILLVSGIGIYLVNEKKQKALLLETNKKEMEFFDTLTSTLNGIKEIKFNKRRNIDLFARVRQLSTQLRDRKVKFFVKYAENYIFSQSFFFVCIAVMVFILPRLNSSYSDVISQTTAAVLFMIGPVSNIAAVIPVLNMVGMAINNIYKLEAELDKMQDVPVKESNDGFNRYFNFNEIEINQVYFEYKNNDSGNKFSVGPLNLKINKGETIFLVGGNGSGKTTLLKTLTMLYYPDSGGITIDNHVINKEDTPYYRELFASVFAEYYLFDRLYGLSETLPEKIKELIRYLRLEDKTDFVDGRFTNLSLSTGQRKRLALIVALLEDKPIYIFDEWAADQDPEFRKFFYEEILTELKNRGKTVLAVSHDDRYFKYADRVLRMEYGQVTENSAEKL